MKKTKKFLLQWLVYFASFIILLIVFYFIFESVHSDKVLENIVEHFNMIGFGAFETFCTQCSTTFIVVSLVSFLASSSENVLWEDIMNFSLINPKIWNFVSISAYLLATLVVSFYFMMVKHRIEIFGCFVISILLICVLLYKITKAFFSRKDIKRLLEKKYLTYDVKEKKAVEAILREKTINSMDNAEYSIVKENIEFMVKHNSVYFDNTLSYVGLKNLDVFIDICNEYNLLLEERIRRIAENICCILIQERKDIRAKEKMIHILYKESKEVNLDTITFIEDGINGSLQYESLISKIEMISKEIAEECKKIEKPVKLLYIAFINSDIDTIDLLIKDIHRKYIILSTSYKNIKKRFDEELNYASIYNQAQIFVALQGIELIDFFTKEERNRIEQILFMDETKYLLLEYQKNMLEECLKKI